MQLDADREESRYVGEYDEPDDDYGDDDAPDEQTWIPDDSTAYWRRRFLILSGGVAALGLCAWLFPGAHQPTARQVAAARASVAAADKRQALPPAALGRAYATPSPTASALILPTALPAGLPSASPAGTVPKKTKISLTYQPRPTSSKGAAVKAPAVKAPAVKAPAVKAPAAGAAKAGACAPGDIVLSLFTSESSYPRGARPTFSVYAVSTASSPCTLRYGAGTVQVMVTRHGQVVWDSNACQPAPAQRVRFTSGVPQVLKIIWNRQAAGPGGCAGSLPASASGTLEAVALKGGQSSPVHGFKVQS